MTAICADELLQDRDRAAAARRPTTQASPAPRAARPVERPCPLRYEDFERRGDGLSALLGGQVFPRRV